VKSANRAIWIVALAVAVLWPSHVLTPLDGVPLNGPLEAVLIGVVLPALIWLSPGFAGRRAARTAIVSLLALKAIASIAAPQHGLCARFTTAAPFHGVISTIDIDEPAGMLRSWDVRADWRSASPRCTAIFDRPYVARERFPIWFVNLLNALRPAADISIAVDGYATVSEPGILSIETGRDLKLEGTLGSVTMAPAGTTLSATVPAGVHRLQLHGESHGTGWRFIPRWNGVDAYSAARLTAAIPAGIDRFVAPALSVLISAVVVTLLVLGVAAAADGRLSTPAAAFGALAAAVLASIAMTGRFERFAPLLLLAAPLVPIGHERRSMRIAFVLLGVPWLAFFVAQSLPRLGVITEYSLGDDWQMFQAAGYSIFLNGQWMRGGSGIFLFQPLYRWVAGGLHVLFGDPSVGEIYSDAASLLAAALMCFALLKPISGFRAAVAGAALTLVTFTIGPIWYLIGRGLSEIAAVGFMSLAMIFMLRARLGRLRAAAFAGLFAVLMFLTRLNHLLLAGFLLAGLMPLRTPSTLAAVASAVRHVRIRSVVVYAAIVIVGTTLYATRTWWYSGHFSVTYGTSFAVQRTGLAPSTLASPAVWANVGESLAGQLTMREPPALDPRAMLMVIGALLSALALLQVPFVNRLPAAIALLAMGTIAGSFIAHTHEYAGRMSVHVVPFTVAMTVCAATRLIRASRHSFDRTSGRQATSAA
jgi:hypothetical protein